MWLYRGAFPGLGAMLCIVGFKFGILTANEIKNRLGRNLIVSYDDVKGSIDSVGMNSLIEKYML